MNTTTNTHSRNLQVGFVGLGDQGAPMAIAIAEAGWPLRVWARHERSYEALGDARLTRSGDSCSARSGGSRAIYARLPEAADAAAIQW